MWRVSGGDPFDICLSCTVEDCSNDVPDDDGSPEDGLQLGDVLEGGASFLDSGLPSFDFLTSGRGKALVALGTFEVLDDTPLNTVKIAVAHWLEVAFVGLAGVVDAEDNSTDRVGVGVVQPVNSLKGV